MKPRNHVGRTLAQFIFCLVVFGTLAFTLLQKVAALQHKDDSLKRQLSNMRQLYMVTQDMALDGVATSDTNLGWPGDTGGSFSNWTAQILKGGYIHENDLCKLLSAEGIRVYPSMLNVMNVSALRVYAVSTNSPANAVFLTSGNFTNSPAGGEKLMATAEPFGSRGFVVFRKSGDGTVFKVSQVGQTNAIGSYVPLCR